MVQSYDICHICACMSYNDNIRNQAPCMCTPVRGHLHKDSATVGIAVGRLSLCVSKIISWSVLHAFTSLSSRRCVFEARINWYKTTASAHAAAGTQHLPSRPVQGNTSKDNIRYRPRLCSVSTFSKQLEAVSLMCVKTLRHQHMQAVGRLKIHR